MKNALKELWDSAQENRIIVFLYFILGAIFTSVIIFARKEVPEPAKPVNIFSEVTPYNPLPFRVATVGATLYHRPFCPYAKQSLAKYGIEKRLNYWSREDVLSSNRTPDQYCLADHFECDLSPAEFATTTDRYCGTHKSLGSVGIEADDPSLVGKTLCSIRGTTASFVNSPDLCVNGYSLPEDTTTVSINQIKLKFGDATKDGQVNYFDYAFFHVCYSANSPATLPCRNTFDYDSDEDVDVLDFDKFIQSYNSGNITWATDSFPRASIFDSIEIPLRVGIEGSQYYHRIDCPSVIASWKKWGIDRRIDFYTWDQIEKSRRIPDMEVCKSGTREHPF